MSPVNRWKVISSFPVFPKWQIDSPVPARPKLEDLVRDFDRLHAGRNAAVIHGPPRIKVLFAPRDRQLAERLHGSQEHLLLFREMELTGFSERHAAQCQQDVDDRVRMLTKTGTMWYLKFDCGEEMVIAKDPIIFYPSRQWTPPGRAAQKKHQGKERQRAALVFRAVWLKRDESKPPEDSQGVIAIADFSQDSPVIDTCAPRWDKKVCLDYETAAKLVPGQELAPRRVLARVFDPKFKGLECDSAGNNALSDMGLVSIPLFWPEGWTHQGLMGLESLRDGWGEESWDVMIHFLTGMYVESIEDLPAPEKIEAEAGRKHAGMRGTREDLDRRGQCYHGAYRGGITVVGPYFIFTVEHGAHVFYVLDSPFYGIALRAYRRKEDAADYARGGADRQRVEHDAEALLFPKIIHDPSQHWLVLFDRAVKTAFGE